MKTRIILCTLLVLSVSCGSDSKSKTTSNTIQKEITSNPELLKGQLFQGAACSESKFDSFYVRDSIEMGTEAEKTISLVSSYYSDSDCKNDVGVRYETYAGLNLTERIINTGRLLKSATFEFDLPIGATELNSLQAYLEQESYCGVTDWSESVVNVFACADKKGIEVKYELKGEDLLLIETEKGIDTYKRFDEETGFPF